MKIFAADDEKLMRQALEDAIYTARPSAEVRSFRNGAELLEAARETMCDVAFLDVKMPGPSGVEVAAKLQKMNPQVNVIFVTGYAEYAADALDMFASGYVMKPVNAEKIAQQLAHLRNPVEERKRKDVYAQTFGSFTLFKLGNPVIFARKKSQMIMAYLIHRQGSVVSRRELSAVLFEDGNYDANRQSHMSKLCADVRQTLTNEGIGDLVIETTGGLALNCEALDCDLYNLLSGDSDALRKYGGEYMAQYSFGEAMAAQLAEKKAP